jgi:hypothetical protein
MKAAKEAKKKGGRGGDKWADAEPMPSHILQSLARK